MGVYCLYKRVHDTPVKVRTSCMSSGGPRVCHRKDLAAHDERRGPLYDTHEDRFARPHAAPGHYDTPHWLLYLPRASPTRQLNAHTSRRDNHLFYGLGQQWMCVNLLRKSWCIFDIFSREWSRLRYVKRINLSYVLYIYNVYYMCSCRWPAQIKIRHMFVYLYNAYMHAHIGD